MRSPIRKFAIIVVSLWFAAGAGAASAAADLKGKSAPDFTLKSSSGFNLRLREYRGRVVMLNFWATWCGPCRQEIPVLNELHGQYEALGFALLGVNIDEQSEVAKSMATELGVAYPIVFDRQKDVSRSYSVDAMPTTVLIDRDGTVRHVHRGYKAGYGELYSDQIRRLMRE